MGEPSRGRGRPPIMARDRRLAIWYLPPLMRALALALALAYPSLAAADEQEFALYKFHQRVGYERSTIVRDSSGTDIRTAFGFTDRTTTVPLAASLHLGRDGNPVSFQLWGKTSRNTRADDGVVVKGSRIVVSQHGAVRTVAAPARFFLASTYAPVIVTQEMLRYWARHGRPPRLAVFPLGEVTIERRGVDTIMRDDGEPDTLTRYAVGGMIWGLETVWLNGRDRLAVLKGVDAEFDHFEATAPKYAGALDTVVTAAATASMAGLQDSSRAAVRFHLGPTADAAARLIDGTGAPPVPDAVVLVDSNRIVAAGSRSRVTVPAGAVTVDATGKTI